MLARGIELGHSSVVAVVSVLKKNTLSYAIVGENPARLVRMRFEDKLNNRILSSD